MSEANKAIVRRTVEEIWNGKNFDKIDEFYAPDFVNHDPSSPDVKNRGQLRQWAEGFHFGFPDQHITIEDMIAEGDKVAKQWSAQAIHTGDFMGITPTNKQTSMSGITIYRIAEGKVKECVWSYDIYGFMVQLGVIPSE